MRIEKGTSLAARHHCLHNQPTAKTGPPYQCSWLYRSHESVCTLAMSAALRMQRRVFTLEQQGR